MLAELAKTHESVRYYIAGSGEEKGNLLQKLVKHLNAEQFIFFLNDISHEREI